MTTGTERTLSEAQAEVRHTEQLIKSAAALGKILQKRGGSVHVSVKLSGPKKRKSK
jgi:hypothetical protein